MVTATEAGRYLQEYIRRYRLEYERFTAPPPEGGGYPRLNVSPYLSAGRLECHLATDGAVLLDRSGEPPYRWEIAGGPAMMSDFPESRVPAWIKEIWERAGSEHTTGIYCIVAEEGVPQHIWRGDLGTPAQTFRGSVDGVDLQVFQYGYDWRELIQRLTYGVIDLIALSLPETDSPFWTPRQIRKLGFIPADGSSKRWFGYAEFLRHTDEAAWDPRSIWARVHVDLRRDFAFAVAVADDPEREGGTIIDGRPETPVGRVVRDRLDVLVAAADGLEHLLETQGDAVEAVFHEYLREHPILLDLYAHAESEPQLRYPEGETSPTGKTYVEPDFILRYLNNNYKLIELERPGHILNTKEGHPRVGMTHGAFQTAEWKDYIGRFYHVISSRYPNIYAGYATALIIGRETSIAAATSVDPQNYIAFCRQIFRVDEVLTYDDLVHRAREAITRLSIPADAAPR